MPDLNPFEGCPLDRAPTLRRDPEWLERQQFHPSSRIVPVWRFKNLIDPGPPPAAVLLPGDRAAGLASAHPLTALLGVDDEAAYVALDVSHIDSPESDARLSALGKFADIHRTKGGLSQREGAILAYARAMMYWHRRHRYCGECGAATVVQEAGHVRVCSNEECAAREFPRTDPAIIVLVTAGDYCLLGRQPSWPSGWYSTLAGFVEPGEGLEDAVRREVLEETDIEIDAVDFHSSQPWPFPSSLMLGFRATARRTPVRVDGDEIEDARWFSRVEVRTMRNGQAALRLPPSVSVARRLIDEWLDAG